ncbi:MAG: response regulator transcription factor [Oxalobacteraceae bacterium]|jgi:DNA-binding response OmpR family regulator|nr:response regulator transcription factor [Oxalobacteraceae bacterium]
MRITIIDSNPMERARMTEVLRAAHYSCTPLTSLEKLASDAAADVDLLVYHWSPTAASQRQLVALRQVRPILPILLVTGRSPDHALSKLLTDPSTDYLVKPVRSHELALRVTILLARFAPQQAPLPTLRFGPYTFDPHSTQAWHDDNPIVLTRKEFLLALLFFRHLGRPLSRATIHEAVWPKVAELNSRSLDTHISRVRSKLALRPENGYRLAPVYSYGYQLEGLEFPEQNPVTPGV